MANFALPKLYFCDECEWRGCEEKLRWIPYNPIDIFLGIDRRNDPNNIIAFKQVCPDCGCKSVYQHLQLATKTHVIMKRN